MKKENLKVTDSRKEDVDIICLARQTSSRFPNKILYEVNGKTILEHIVKKLKMCDQRIIFAIPENHKNDELADKLSELSIETFRGSETNVLERFIEASKIASSKYVQRFCCDNLLFDPQYITECYSQLDDSHNVFSNKSCTNSAGQSVEIIRKCDCEVTVPATTFEEEHVFPYFYRIFPAVKKLRCPTKKLFPIDTYEDIQRVITNKLI